MSGPPPPRPDGSPGDRPPPRGPGISALKAVVLLVVAIVLGVLMLQVGSRPPTDVASTTVAPPPTTPTTPTTSTLPGTPTTAPTSTTTKSKHHGAAPVTTVPRSSVKVLVANGTTMSNQATIFSQRLQTQGWTVLSPVDTTAPAAASSVYFAAGQQPQADEVASSLKLKSSAVQPLTTSVPVPGASGADVVVVVGPDLAQSGTSGATTTS